MFGVTLRVLLHDTSIDSVKYGCSPLYRYEIKPDLSDLLTY